MSTSTKRKSSQISASTGRSGAGSGARKTAAIVHGWADLPAELIRGVGQLHDKPRDLASMERTCRSWRKVVLEGNDDMEIPDTCMSKANEEKVHVSLWRDLALANFPALPSIVKALQENERKRTNRPGISSDEDKAIFSWKSMFRSQHCVAKLPMYSSQSYRPKTSVHDYIFSYEFRRHSTKELLFVTSGGMDKKSPQLWNQEIINSYDGDFPKLKGPVDPNLIALMGDDPFSETKVRDIDIRAVVTRVSDMKAVELSSSLCLAIDPNDGGDVSYGGGCCCLTMASTRFDDDDCEEQFLHRYTFAPNLLGDDEKWIVALYLYCSTGRVSFYLEKHVINVEEYAVDVRNEALYMHADLEVIAKPCEPQQILEYLETRCPFGKRMA